jgi:hypothetical protein
MEEARSKEAFDLYIIYSHPFPPQIAKGLTVDDIKANTGCSFDVVEGEVPLMDLE